MISATTRIRNSGAGTPKYVGADGPRTWRPPRSAALLLRDIVEAAGFYSICWLMNSRQFIFLIQADAHGSPKTARIIQEAATRFAEQKEQRIEAGAKFAPISTYIFGVPAPLILILVWR